MKKNNKSAWTIIKRTTPLIKKQNKWVVMTILFALLAAISAFGLPYSMMTLTDLAISGNRDAFKNFLWIGFILAGIDFVVMYLWKRSGLRLKAHLIHDMRIKLSDHLQKMETGALEKFHSGDLSLRAGENVNGIASFLLSAAEFIHQPLKLVVAMFFIGWLNWKMLVFLMVVVPAATPLYNLLSRPLEKYYSRIRSMQGQASALVEDTLRGIYVLKAFNLQHPLSEKYTQLLYQIKNQRLLAEKQQAFLMLVGSFIRFLPLLLGYVLAGYLAFLGELRVGGLMALINLTWVVISAYEALLMLIGQLRETIPVGERYFEVMDQPVEMHDNELITNAPSSSKEVGKPAIVFKQVKFGYQPDQLILHDVSFKVDQGETVALVGSSGCGKSTIMKLICGFYYPYEGEIQVNGQVLTPKTIGIIRGNITLVSQDTYLFPFSIKENLILGREDLSMASINNATQASNSYEFITQLPYQYDTIIQEGAKNFSGGQKQCLAIARSMIKDASILLLDEPTAALDAKSEMQVQQALQQLTRGKTVFMITHRLASIRNAQRILVLDQGRIVEEGTQQELIAQKGVYWRLYQHQLEDGKRDKESSSSINEVMA